MLSERIAGWLETMTVDAVVIAHGAVSRALRGLVVGMAGNDVARLDIPQDRVLVLRRGSMEWV
jgi:probable phosphoglycerate mutase